MPAYELLPFGRYRLDKFSAPTAARKTHDIQASDAAFSQRKACVKGKVEFGGKVGSAGKLQAGTVIAQISHDTTHRRAVGRNDLSALEYLSSRKAPTIEHVSTKLQF